MAQTIKIGVEFFDAQESAKALLDQLKKEAGRFKAGTAISDALVGDIKTLESIIKKLDSSLAKGFNSHGDVNKVVNDFNQISGIYEHVASTIEKTKFQDLNLNFGDFSQLAKDLSSATAELAKFKSQKEKIEQTTVQDLLGKTSKNLSLFSTDQLSASSTTVWSKLTQDLEKYKNSLSDAEQRTKALQNSYNAAVAAANTGNQVYKRDNDILSLIGESPKNQADMKTIRGSFIQDIQASLKLDDNKMNLSKAFSVNQKKTLEEWLAPLGLSADSVQDIIATGKSRAEALSEELAKLPYKDISKVRKAAKNSLAQRTLNDEAAKARKEYESAEKKRAAKEQTVNETEARIKALETPLQQKNYLSTGSNTTLDQKISNLLSRVQALETQLRQKASSGLNAGVNGSGNIPSVSGEPYHNALNQQAETDYLQRQGRAMIQRWIGTRAIINQVRKGIRQAYQDIKSLDAAMTNIAVVTDMSVGDLWGKIDSYMSIAKQYGVTTQGVYEVSQLYYQQGLSTSEVMAATSETLKMARIAGMDYAEAADAMTVAIRAFKMEMSDAQTVTDVYSKVAAITASDSEELAIAMSKTASSAASVGSSFENTTAMLAVMVETTRESAQNLGSALKSIISRYGEMKTGATVDEDGEIIDYNKVDTALKSIGISLKDAQYQFRDFDDVIFELSEKWDSLDKNTQRYIATIMAGNRQQSRFIALVDNWERLDEVATAAQDSEDAGLLQYAKTLDSLETKLNNIKTSFQEFYMSIINGPVIGKALETINSLFEGFNKQGSFAAILDVGSIVSSLTIIGNMFVSIFSGAFGQISANWKAMLYGLPADAAVAGQRAGNQYRNGATQPKGIGKLGTGLATGASFAGLALTTIGAATTEKQHDNVGAGISAIGNALSYGSMGFILSGGNPIVAIVAGALGGITSAVSSWRSDLELEQAKLKEATEKAEKSNIARAEKKTEYDTLNREISNLEKLEKARFDSAEAQQEWINANNALFEQFPYLAATFDEIGNATIDLESAEQALAIARKASLQATVQAAEDEKNRIKQDIATSKSERKDKFESEFYGSNNGQPGLISENGESIFNNSWPNILETWKSISPDREFNEDLIFSTLTKAGIIIQDDNKNYQSQNAIMARWFEYFGSSLDFEDQSMLSWFEEFQNLDQEESLTKLLTEGPKRISYIGEDKHITAEQMLFDWLYTGDNNAYSVDESDAEAYNAALEHIQKILSSVNQFDQDITQKQFALAGADRTLISGKVQQEISNIESKRKPGEDTFDETFGQISNWEDYIQKRVQKINDHLVNNMGKEGLTDEEIIKETEKGIEYYKEFYETLEKQWKIDDYNELIKAFEKGTISYSDYLTGMKDFFGEDISEWVIVAQDNNKEIKEKIKKSQANLILSLNSKSAWNLEEDQIINSDFLNKIPEFYYEEISEYAEYIQKQFEGGKVSKESAGKMAQSYYELLNALSEIENPEARTAAFNASKEANITSISGIRDLQAILAKAGITIENDVWTNLIQSATTNLITEFETLQSNIASSLDNSAKAIKSAYNGVDSATEALELANKFGVSLADFEVRDGKFYFEDVEKIKDATEKEWSQLQKDLLGEDSTWQSDASAFGKAYQNAAGIKDYDELLRQQKTLQDKQKNTPNEMEQNDLDKLALFNQYGTQYGEWAKKQLQADNKADISFQAFIAQVRDTSAEALASMYDSWLEQIELEATRQSKINELYGGEEQRKRVQAEKTLASRGAYGYTGEEVQNLIERFGLTKDDFDLQADGTFDLDTASETLKSLDLPQYIWNAINASIEATTKSAEEGLQKLGETAATGKKLDASEIRNLLGAEFDGLNDAQAEVLYTYFKNYAEGTSSKEDLIKVVSLMLRRQADSKGQNLSLEDAKNQAEKYISEIDAELVDAVEANLSKRLELQAKVLQGTATETEKNALKDAGIDISGLESKTNEAIVKWINFYIESTDISFDEKVKYAKTAFSTALTNEFGEDIGTLGETAVKGVFGTQDAASDFISKYYAILGQTIDEKTADSLVSSWFTRDDSGQYRLKKTIQSLRDELSKIQDSANQEEIDNLEAQLTYYENLQELQHKESLTSSLKSLATSSDNITASQMMSLIQDQGETVSISEAETYAKDLQNLNPIERLKELVKILAQEQIPVDADAYQDLVKETITSIMNSASTSINKLGSGMSWNDAFSLTEEIEGLNFSDFEVIGDQYFINNTEKAVKYYQKQVSAAFDEQAKMIEGAADVPIKLLQSGNLGDWADSPVADLSGQYKKAQALIQSEYFDETHYKQWLSQAGNDSKNFGQYWQEYINSLDEAAQAAILAWEKEANRQKNIAQYAAKWGETLEDKGVDKTKVEGLNLLKSKGYKGYTEQDMGTLQAGGLIKTDEDSLKRIQKQIDAETGTFYLTENDLQPLTAATRNALKLTLDQEVQSAKTAAENLATKMANGTAEFGDYEALFKESITPENFDIIEPLLKQYVEDQSNATDVKNALKRAYPKAEEEDIDAILANWVAFYNDAKHETARSIFDIKIEALSSGYLSEASKETLKKGGASDFVTKFASLAGKAADEIFDAVYEEYEKAYDAGDIKRDEYRTGIAEAASKAFTAKVEAKKPSLYLDDATKEIAGGDALYDADALGSLYAAIADKQKATKKEEVLTFDEFYNEYVNGITEAGEAILDVKKLNEKDYVSDRRYKEYSSALVENLFSSAENIITQFKSGDTTGLDLQIQQMFDSLGMALSDKDAKAILDGGQEVLLNRLIFEINRAGLDATEVQSRLQELQALILDTITESISSGLSSLGEGIAGTLSEASFLDLQKKYKFEDSSYRTSRGVQLSAQNRQDIISGLYGEAKANGRTAGFGEQLLEILNTEGSGIEGYKDIEEAIADANKQIAEGVDGAKEYAEALKLARDAAYEMADAAEIAFMEQDPYNGKADTFDKFIENVKKAKEALATFGKGGKIAHTDLAMMFDVIKNGSQESINKFVSTFKAAGDNMESILASAHAFMDTAGEIDIGKWALEMGIDVKTATTAMAEGMTDSLRSTAQSQIDYLSGLEAMLQAMVALEGIDSIKLDLEFNTGLTDDKGNPIIVKQLSEVYDWWDKLSENQQLELQANITTTLKNASGKAELQSFMKGFGFGSADFFTTFFGAEVDSVEEVQLADAFGSLIQQIPNMTEGQVETVVEEMNRVLQDSMLHDQDGKFVGLKEGYINSLLQLFSTFNLSDIPESLNTKIREALATNNNRITIPIKGGIDIAITSSADGKGLNIVDANGKALTGLSDKQISAVKETLASQLGMAVENIKIDAKTGLVSFYGEAAQTEAEALKTEFTSISEAATGVSDAITALNDLLTNFQVSDAFREFVTLMTQLVTGSAGVTKTVEGTQNAANMEKVAGEGEGNGENERTITLNIDITAAELAFKTIEEYYKKLAQLVSTPISVDLNSVTATTSQALTNQGGNVPPATNPGGGVVSPLTTHTVQIVWDITEPDFDSIQAPTLDFKWMKKSPPTPSYNPTINYKWGSATNKITYSGAAIEVPIKLVEESTQQAWTGTMNNIAGAAFADGSISNLYSGASFASKTLVGELGPELAVYDGQYHLLGQHGAEFVNLPKDAIVFNHKQTEGIAKGQFNIRGKAMAEGNITGPAMAGGAQAALAAVQRAKSLWQGLLNKLTAAELAGGSTGGGGGGNTLKGVKEELQEWYNLSRKIADIEQEINNILAERENIPREDGNAYLRSLREQQKLLQEQAATQEILLNYQKLQLERQAENINNNAIWSQFLTVDSNGLLQYTKGNELFGGKGALEVLSDLNEMSGAEQLEFLESLGYTAYDQDGKALEGTELIQKFFEELQYQIDEYDSLYDTIHSTSEELQKLQTEINKINDEITQNQMDLEEDIYNILVDAWEEEIEALEEQKELIEEANEAYVKGLNEALSAEREMYSEEQSIANREQLQRQLSLLRRSGGSASEIANLEKQLDSMLQEEYFRNQEKMIQSIEDANKEQVQQLEHQIRLQEEALEFEKEHGILWTKVYEIMAGSKDEILAFMQNNYPGFFSQSVLEQRKMLTDWAHEIGIYTENRTFEEHKTYAQSNIWNTGAIWAQGNMGGYQSMFNALTPEQQAAAREQFNTTYASARLAGDDHETAMRKANASLTKYLTASKEQQEAEKNKKPNTDKITNPSPSTPPASTPTYSTVSISVSANPSAGGSPTVSKTKANAGDTITVYPKPKEGYAFSHITVGNSRKSGTTFQVTGQISSVKVVVYYTETSKVEEEEKAKTGDAGASSLTDKGISKNVSTKAYSSGGLVDYTGPAIVHGSPSKPEAFLNAKQTAMISEAVKFAGDGGALDGIKATLNALNASIKSIVNNNRNEISSFTVAPGAVTIQVAELSDSYDVEELSRDVMNRMVAIASKSTNRGVSRR